MDENVKYYVKLDKFSLFNVTYAYLDTPDHTIDFLLRTNGLQTVKFEREYHHADSEYVVVFCKFSKKEEKQFLEAMAAVPARMALVGHPDYEKEAIEFYNKLMNLDKIELTAPPVIVEEEEAPTEADEVNEESVDVTDNIETVDVSTIDEPDCDDAGDFDGGDCGGDDVE